MRDDPKSADNLVIESDFGAFKLKQDFGLSIRAAAF
jgi:hypothetical protein